MAGIRINSITDERTALSSDDYFVVDNPTSNTTYKISRDNLISNSNLMNHGYENGATFTASPNTTYFVDTTSNAVTSTLPASPITGDRVIFVDWGSNFNTNNLTINPGAGHTILNTSSLVLNTQNDSANLVFYNNNWSKI